LSNILDKWEYRAYCGEEAQEKVFRIADSCRSCHFDEAVRLLRQTSQREAWDELIERIEGDGYDLEDEWKYGTGGVNEEAPEKCEPLGRILLRLIAQ